MTPISFLPILVASVVAFGVSAFWYSPILFGNEWMRLSKISDKDVSDMATKGLSSMWRLYVIQFVATLIIFSVLGFIISASGSQSVSDGLFLAFIVWLGFSVTRAAGEMLWKKVQLKLMLISEICTLVAWLAGGAIIAAWR